MIKRLLKCAILGIIIGIVLNLGIVRYQDDQDAVYHQIAQIQRQQEILLISTDNPLPALIKKVMPSVVYVRAPGQWSGSGVIIGPHTVLTARHVIQDANELYIETVDGEQHKAIGWIEDEENDCGLMFFDPREKFENIVDFADSNKLQIGDIVFTIGSPLGRELFNTATLGIISGLDRKILYFGTCGLLTSDVASNSGNSGGPVFDMHGRIVGIVVGSFWDTEGLNIIIPADVCRKLYEKISYKIGIGESNSSDRGEKRSTALVVN